MRWGCWKRKGQREKLGKRKWATVASRYADPPQNKKRNQEEKQSTSYSGGQRSVKTKRKDKPVTFGQRVKGGTRKATTVCVAKTTHRGAGDTIAARAPFREEKRSDIRDISLKARGEK